MKAAKTSGLKTAGVTTNWAPAATFFSACSSSSSLNEAMVQPVVKSGRPSRSNPARSLPSCRVRMAASRPSSFISLTGWASRWSPTAMSSLWATIRFWIPSTWAPRRSLCKAMLLRSLTYTCMMASMPCCCIRTPPASALIFMTPLSISGMIMASTRPLIRRESITILDMLTPLGVCISARTTNSPADKRFRKLIIHLILIYRVNLFRCIFR